MVKHSRKKSPKLRSEKNKKRPNCSHKKKPLGFTCYSEKSIHKLKKYWNARHPDAPIITNDNRAIWKQLKSNLGKVCKQERCWLNQHFVREKLDKELLQYTFAPDSPQSWNKAPNTWLNSLDIDNVMKQYEKEYPNFEFIGPSPIDFDKRQEYGECVWGELCHFNFTKKLQDGIKKIGIVFNTDPHDEPGEHWVALFIDIDEKFIFYFNSTGEAVIDEIKVFIDRVIEQADKNKIKMKFIQNHPKEHQKTQTECGIYVLFMIIELLKGTKDPKYFQTHTVPDQDMINLRKVYFN
jgi:hypothetical protein